MFWLLLFRFILFLSSNPFVLAPRQESSLCVFILFSLYPFPLLLLQAKDGDDGRKSFTKRGSKPGDATDFPPSGADAQLLDPISEEDEKLDHSTSSRTSGSRRNVGGSCYHRLPNDDDSGPEEADNTTPLLRSAQSPSLDKPDFLPDVPDQKDSSDSGMRSSGSSSLEEAEVDAGRGVGAVTVRGPLPSSLSGLQDVARMSICSEAASEVSLMASSPDEGWTAGGNLNRSESSTTLNNNGNSNSNNSAADSPPPIIITPGSSSGSSTTTTATVHNQNLHSINLGDERESVL